MAVPYPYIGLGQAMEHAAKIFKKEKTFPATREALALTIGYSSRNGGSDSALTTLVSYGLLEQVEDRKLQITPFCVDILTGNQSDPDRLVALIDASRSIEVFEAIRERFGDRTVNEETLIAYLVQQELSERTAGQVARAYNSTIEYLNRETQRGQTKSYGSVRENAMPSQDNLTAKSPSTPRTLQVPVDELREVLITFPDERVTVEEVDRVIEYLTFMRDFLSKNRAAKLGDNQSDRS